MRLTRVRNRVYDGRRVKTHAEYAVVVVAQQTVAHIIFNRGVWIAVQRVTDKSFGKVVSPIGLVLLRDVKQWAMRKWGTGEKGKGENADAE